MYWKQSLLAAASISLFATGALAQSGSVSKAVGGYSFEEAAKEAPGTKNFNSADGQLTIAIVTHTAGNGFFDPVYVGARVAANMIGARILLLGSESPTDDPAREIEILNQIVRDPTIDGIIMTTPQVGAYNDIVKAAEARGIPVATTNSFDGTIRNRNGISHTGQDASAAAIAGEALVACLEQRGITKGSIILPNDTAMGNIEVNNRVTAAYRAIVAALKKSGKLANFKVDAGPESVGVSANMNDPVNSIISLIESRRRRGRCLRGQQRLHAGACQGRRANGKHRQDVRVWLRPGPGAAGGAAFRRAHWRARPATLPAGVLAGDAAVSSDRSRHLGSEPRHTRAARDQGNRRSRSASVSRTSVMIEKSATSRSARFGSGLLDLNHTSIMISLVSFRSRNS